MGRESEPLSNVCDWASFEEDVKQALEAIGYRVERDKSISGCQVDLYAERQREFFNERLLVECKKWDRPIGVGEVRQMAGLVDSLATRKAPCHGLMVSAGGFSNAAKRFAEEAGISLQTLEDLSSLSLDPNPILDQIIQSFENDELGSSYVQLSCQVTEAGLGTIYKPVESFLHTFLLTTTRPGVAVLGNFGTGKTSLCKHYAYWLAKRWRDPKSRTFLPIYINLRDLSSFFLLENAVFELVENRYHARATIQGLRLWLRHGRVLLLLDGFDEMASRLDRVAIDENLRALMQFAESFSTKLILTCRTHFFRTQVDEKPLARMLRLYMRDWGTEELIEYVERSMPGRSKESLRTIRETYNLEELSKTPLFLNMITATLGELGGSVNKAKLYQLYTDRWIEAQEYRSRVSPEEKRHFMEMLAYEMFARGTAKMAYHEIPERIRILFNIREYESVARFDQDIRTCSFLIRDSDGEYHFVHKSYMEFFVAFRLSRQFKEKNFGEFSKKEVTVEIAGFMADFFESDWGDLIRQLLGAAAPLVRANCALVLGNLPFRSEVQEALLLALGTESEEFVKERIVDAIVEIDSAEGISRVIKLAMSAGSLGLYCLEAVARSLPKAEVVSLYSDAMNTSKDPLRLRIVLDAISTFPTGELRESLSGCLERPWWYGEEEVVSAMLRAIEAIADLNLALKSERFLLRYSFTADQVPVARAVKEGLALRFRAAVEEAARENHARKVIYSQNEGRLRRQFKFLIDEQHLKSVLGNLYGERGKKAKDDKSLSISDRRRSAKGAS